ncbi:MAG: COX15/CtaA family protein [Myxococcota bacterium]|jgi:cytochrome c oxidase assembly protein subunit 15|nr:hypothetical protein [Deltaproteobacteria bacterium]MCP4241801.1 hypothetical protein [bacterium]MDP6074150.1 COX15/CtaA family protein [Myxococcota bacterium]MDP6241779.1 COX15/CtaA family protein [Myxococcota bacterium]MDP7074585.1 COX15/CtaA family protein [Myxococcota bacterium]
MHEAAEPADAPVFLVRALAALVAATSGLIVLGALVRANDAGLACPDWPLCFGEFVPRMDLRVGFEYAHRVFAGSVGLCFAALAVAVLRRPPLRRRCATSLAVAAVLLAAQVILGALTVWQLLAAWTVTAHLLTGNAFAATLLWTLLSLRGGGGSARGVSGTTRGVLAVTSALLLLQMLLGGLVASRYAGLACTEWPACNAGIWFPSFEGAVGIHLLHRWNAVLLVGALAALCGAARDTAGLGRIAGLALALGLVQVGVGVANVLMQLPVEVTGLHAGLATVLVLTLTAAVHRSR